MDTAVRLVFWLACAGWTVWWGYLLARRGGACWFGAAALWLLAAFLVAEVSITAVQMNRGPAAEPQGGV